MIAKTEYIKALILIDDYHQQEAKLVKDFKPDKETETPVLIEVAPIEKPKQKKKPKVVKKSKRTPTAVARIKILTDLGFTENVEEKQFVRSGLGLATSFIECTTKVSFDNAVKDLKANIAKHEKDGMPPPPKGTVEGKATTTGTLSQKLISEEEQEVIEQDMAIPFNPNEAVKPITPQEAFLEKTIAKEQAIFEKETGVTENQAMAIAESDSERKDDMKYQAKDPMEQMKKNNGENYLNRAGETIVQESDEIDTEPTLRELWDDLQQRCTEHEISTTGLEFEAQNREDLVELHKYVDSTIKKRAKV